MEVRGSQGDLVTEPDGSTRVFFGPEAPDGYDANWAQTITGEGFFVYLRLYGPNEPYYDRSWWMPDPHRIT